MAALALLRGPRERRSTYDPNGDVTVSILNDTGAAINIGWLDYEGTEIAYGKGLGAGQTFSQNTNADHPWRVSDASNGQELGCVLFVGSGDVTVTDIRTCSEQSGGSGGAGASHGRSRQAASRRRQLSPQGAQTDGELETGGGESKGEKEDHRLASICTGPDCGPIRGGPTVEGCGGKTYEMVQYGGWLTCFMEVGVVEKYGERLEALLEADALEIRRVLPDSAISLLGSKSALWMNDSYRYDGEDVQATGICCHWSKGWLVPRGNMGEKEGCVECYSAQNYLDWHSTQPAVLLHELCHAFHKWSDKSVDITINRGFEECMKSGRYDQGEYMTTAIHPTSTWDTSGAGASSKPYGASNAMEFFAETCEAFFSSRRFRNDFFPYVHAELRTFDPVAYKMVEDVFGIRGDELPTRAEFPEDWRKDFAKIDVDAVEALFRGKDEDQTGTLDAAQFCAMLGALGTEAAGAVGAVGFGADEVAAAMHVADVNRDGVVDLGEFLAWLTSMSGGYARGV